jgi:hypothetical protein
VGRAPRAVGLKQRFNQFVRIFPDAAPGAQRRSVVDEDPHVT